MVAGADYGDSFTRDMGYSEEEFFRVLPKALAGYTYTVEGNRVIITGARDDRRLELSVAPLPDRRIAMMRIPRTQVAFEFWKFSETERREFMTRFDRSFQKGGG